MRAILPRATALSCEWGDKECVAHCCNAVIELSDIFLATNPPDYHPYLDQTSFVTATLKTGVPVTASYAMAIGRAFAEPILQRIARLAAGTELEMRRNRPRRKQDSGDAE